MQSNSSSTSKDAEPITAPSATKLLTVLNKCAMVLSKGITYLVVGIFLITFWYVVIVIHGFMKILKKLALKVYSNKQTKQIHEHNRQKLRKRGSYGVTRSQGSEEGEEEG